KYKRKFMVREFTRLAMIAWQKDGPAVRSSESAVKIAPLRARVVGGRTRPLKTDDSTQAVGRNARHVARLARRQPNELVPYLTGRTKIKSFVSKLSAQARQNLPVRHSLARRIKQLGTVADCSFAVGAGPIFFAPLSSRQDHVRQPSGFRGMIG